MKRNPQHYEGNRDSAMTWVSGRLMWDKRLTELRSGSLDHKVRAVNHRAA